MHTVRQISLNGHPSMFRLNEEAYDVLARYLDRARLRLANDPDHEEVLRDLEQSIAEKLAARLRTADQVVTVAEVNAVLAQVGPVETGQGEPSPAAMLPPGRRPLRRITEGQQILGVCQGLAAYSDIRVDWVRTAFVLLSLVTGGAWVLVYGLMAFLMPTVATKAEYAALQRAAATTAPVSQ